MCVSGAGAGGKTTDRCRWDCAAPERNGAQVKWRSIAPGVGCGMGTGESKPAYREVVAYHEVVNASNSGGGVVRKGVCLGFQAMPAWLEMATTSTKDRQLLYRRE